MIKDCTEKIKSIASKYANNKLVFTYLRSLCDYAKYANLSYQLFEKVYNEHRQIIDEKQSILIEKAISAPNTKIAIHESDLQSGSINICGLKVIRDHYLQKCVCDFFHFARMCTDEVLQLINEIFAEDKIDSEHVTPGKLLETIKDKKAKTVVEYLRQDNDLQYLVDADNYLKHINIVTIKLADMPWAHHIFISGFRKRNHDYPAKEVIPLLNTLSIAVGNYLERCFDCLLQ